MNLPPRIYLDNAATSWPKPEDVYVAVDRYQRQSGAPAGRSTYRQAAEVERLIEQCRGLIAELIGAREPHHIVFTCNGTDALNLAIHGLLREGDHVITSVVEHNSTLRPLRHLQETRGIDVTRVPCDGCGIVDPDAIRQAIRNNTRLVALVHASNVTGALQPVAETGRIAREHDVLFLVDAAQSLGHVPIDLQQWPVDLLAAPGHKGLFGPLGTGILYVRPGVERQLASVRQGGTGTRSEEDRQPQTVPDKYESGNHNVPGIAGLAAGIRFLREQGLASVAAHERQLTDRLLSGFAGIEGVVVHGPREAERQVGVVSITFSQSAAQEVASVLDTAYSIQVRSGLHCAPLMHQALGTVDHGGTVRFSMSAMNTQEQIDAAIQAVAQIAATLSI